VPKKFTHKLSFVACFQPSAYNVPVRRPTLSMLLVLALAVSCNSSSRSVENPSHQDAYTNTELGFSFTPPAGFRDVTAASSQDAAADGAKGRAHFQVLLWMMSGPDDTAPDWLALGIETFPRGRDLDKSDDVTASFITNEAVTGGKATERKAVRISGRNFAMTRVEKKEPPLTKHAIVYTTVYKEKFVSFFFAGNTREKVDEAAQSIISVRFGI
jgi:hypothetical protein